MKEQKQYVSVLGQLKDYDEEKAQLKVLFFFITLLFGFRKLE